MRVGSGFPSQQIMAEFSSSAQSWAPSGSAWMGQPRADTRLAFFTLKIWENTSALRYIVKTTAPTVERDWAELLEKNTKTFFWLDVNAA